MEAYIKHTYSKHIQSYIYLYFNKSVPSLSLTDVSSANSGFWQIPLYKYLALKTRFIILLSSVKEQWMIV